MKSPILWAAAAGAAILCGAFAPTLWQMLRTPASDPAVAAAPGADGLPWQTELAADGALQVFGVAIGRATLAQAEQRYGDALQVALVARRGEPPALEALLDPHQAGYISGRLVLAFAADPGEAQRWLANCRDSAPMDGGARRFVLRPQDLAEARRAPLVGLSFVPALRLDEDAVRRRFGPPQASLAIPGPATALLYPARGLVATVAAGERGVLQYVAPRDFETRLHAPLRPYEPTR